MDASNTPAPGNYGEASVISAHFDDPNRARAAIEELRGQGISPSDITVSARTWEADEDDSLLMQEASGSPRQALGTANTARVAPELPNDEELPTTHTHMTGGGRDAGASTDQFRRIDASADADVDIYSDFPDAPGGLNPRSPAAQAGAGAGAEVDFEGRGTGERHSDNSGVPPATGNDALVSVRADDAHRDFVRAIFEAHGGRLEA